MLRFKLLVISPCGQRGRQVKAAHLVSCFHYLIAPHDQEGPRAGNYFIEQPLAGSAKALEAMLIEGFSKPLASRK